MTRALIAGCGYVGTELARTLLAEAADEVLVFDQGRIVQRGPHAQLVSEPDSVYARLHAAWLQQTRTS